MWHMHTPTFNKWHQKKKNKKVTLRILKHGAMRGCGLTSLVVRINDKIHDIRERNVTIRSEIWTTNIRSLAFWNVIEWLILWRLVLRSVGCNVMWVWFSSYFMFPNFYQLDFTQQNFFRISPSTMKKSAKIGLKIKRPWKCHVCWFLKCINRSSQLRSPLSVE